MLEVPNPLLFKCTHERFKAHFLDRCWLMLLTKTAVHFGSLITLLRFGRVLYHTSSFTTPASARATKTASKTPLPNVFMGWHLNPIQDSFACLRFLLLGR